MAGLLRGKETGVFHSHLYSQRRGHSIARQTWDQITTWSFLYTFILNVGGSSHRDSGHFRVKLFRNSRAGVKGGEQEDLESALGSTGLRTPPTCRGTGLKARQLQPSETHASDFAQVA